MHENMNNMKLVGLACSELIEHSLVAGPEGQCCREVAPSAGHNNDRSIADVADVAGAQKC